MSPSVRPSAAVQSRIHELDALRGIAALMVMVFHFSSSYGRLFGHPDGFWLDFEIGRRGVELFFMVSGFVIFMTLRRADSAGRFAVARFSRLFPTYWFAVIFASAMLVIVGLPGYSVSWPQLISNLTMLQTFLGIADIDNVYWTLGVELAFYGWMIVAVRLGIMRRTDTFLLGWLAAWIASVVLIAVLDLNVPAGLAAAMLLSHGHLFVAGILFYLSRSEPSRLRTAMIGVTLAQELVIRPESIAVVGCWYVLFGLLIAGRLTLLNRRPLLFIGAISYPLYLVHNNLGYMVIEQLQVWGVDDTIVLVAVPALVSITVATAVHAVVELPGQRAIQSWFGSRASVSPPRRELVPATTTAAARWRRSA